MISNLGLVEFPEFVNTNINMMPIMLDDPGTWTPEVESYRELIEKCKVNTPMAYVSIHAGYVSPGATLRRPGVHTEGWGEFGWGGSPWGGSGGVHLASTDGACRVWDTEVYTPSVGGACEIPNAHSIQMQPSTLYAISDRTPHEATPGAGGNRQWFRLVADDIGVWYSKHSTPNPHGVLPNAPVVDTDKFVSLCK